MSPLLLSWASSADRREPIPPEVQAWLQDGMRSWLAGAATSIDGALGLGGQVGRRSVARQFHQVLRDARIVDAGLQLGGSKLSQSRELSRRWGRLLKGFEPRDAVDRFLLPAVQLSGISLGEHAMRRILR